MVSATASFAQGKLLSKMIAKVAKKTGDVNVVTVNTLDDIVPMGGVETNLHPVELGTMSQSFFDGWQTGGEQVAFTFFKKNTNNFFKIDGTVTIDGQPVEYVSVGTYSAITPPKGSPRKVEIVTSTGQKSSFTIAPSPYSFKVVSINGQTDKISLDLSKDVVIELQGNVPTDELLKINLAINQVSIKSIYAVCYMRGGSTTLTIPAAAFRNTNIKPAGGAVYGYKKSFLSVGVETIEMASDVSGPISSVQYTQSYNDGKMVNITTEPELNTGMIAKGKENLKDGEMSYEFVKLNAFMSRPSSQLKKVGLLSASVSGKTFVENSVIQQEEDLTKGDARITRTTTIEFPSQSDAVWSGLLEKMYPEIVAIIQTELKTSVLPADATTKTASYKGVENFLPANKNGKEEFSLAYPNTKVFAGIPGSETVGVNAVNERIMSESGTDGLMTLSLELQAEQDGDFGVLVPKLTVEITGKINGISTPTKFFTGTVTGKGVPSDKIGLKVVWSSPITVGAELKGRNDTKVYHTTGQFTPAEIEALIRKSDLIAQFRKGLQDIVAKEKANTDYETVWNLRK